MQKHLPELRRIFETAENAVRLQEQRNPHRNDDYMLLIKDRRDLTKLTMELVEADTQSSVVMIEATQIVGFFRSVRERVRLLESGSQDEKLFLSLGFPNVEAAISFEEKILLQALDVIPNLDWFKGSYQQGSRLLKVISNYEAMVITNIYTTLLPTIDSAVRKALPQPYGKSSLELCQELFSFINDGQREALKFLKSWQDRRKEKAALLHKKLESLAPERKKLEPLFGDRNSLSEILVRLGNQQSTTKIAVVASIGELIASARKRIELLQKGSPAEVEVLSEGYDGAAQVLLFEKKILLEAMLQMDSLLERSTGAISPAEAIAIIKSYNSSRLKLILSGLDGKSPEECYKTLHALVYDIRKKLREFLETLEATKAKQVGDRVEKAPASELQSLLERAEKIDNELSKKLPNFLADEKGWLVGLVEDRTSLARLAVLFENHNNNYFAPSVAALIMPLLRSACKRIATLLATQAEPVLLHGFDSRSEAINFERNLFCKVIEAMESSPKLLKSGEETPTEANEVIKFYYGNLLKMPERIIRDLPQPKEESSMEFCRKLRAFVSYEYQKQLEFSEALSAGQEHEKRYENVLRRMKVPMNQKDNPLGGKVWRLMLDRDNAISFFKDIKLDNKSLNSLITIALAIIRLALSTLKRIELLQQSGPTFQKLILLHDFCNSVGEDNAAEVIDFEKELFLKIIEHMKIVPEFFELVQEISPLQAKMFVELYWMKCFRLGGIEGSRENLELDGKSDEEFCRSVYSFVFDQYEKLLESAKALEDPVKAPEKTNHR